MKQRYLFYYEKVINSQRVVDEISQQFADQLELKKGKQIDTFALIFC